MTSTLLKKYAAPVPRYTSYPTAPHFNERVTAEVYADWLAQLSPDQPLSLYFHVPYCDTLCWFCGCHTKITARYGPIDDYLASMMAEIDLVADRMPTRMQVSHIHWGGGSPTILKPSDMLMLSERIHARFDVTDEAEFAVEIDPRDFGPVPVRALADAGVNRVSLGVQDVNLDVQKAINRVQPFEETREVVENLRAEGITEINIDLMYGLPLQTDEHIRETVTKVLELAPSRIALFGYAHVPWMKSHQKMINEAALPDSDTRLKHMNLATDLLVEAGYVAIGLDHFALPDDPLARAQEDHQMNRNFQGYTTDGASTLIGFGASAIGASPSGYAQNIAAIRDYRRAVDAGELPISKGIELSTDDRMRRDLIQTLMCNLEVDLSELLAAHSLPLDALDDEYAGLRDLEADGIIDLNGTQIHVTEEGRQFVRVVCARFDAYLGRGPGRHSQAV